MTAQSNPPIVFLAFANDRIDDKRYLRNLPEELRSIRDLLCKAEEAGHCQVVYEANATLETIQSVFQKPEHKNRISIFHYGGHANQDGVVVEDHDGQPVFAHAQGLAEFLGLQQGLELVFLNGCSTGDHAKSLMAAGIPKVIATSQDIQDALALEFAEVFYKGYAAQLPIEQAYLETVALLRTRLGVPNETRVYRHLVATGAERHQDDQGWPWHLYLHRDQGSYESFVLPVPPSGSPFRPLQRYVRTDAAIFAGRNPELRQICDAIDDPKGPPVFLLYGASGVGKSSLLEAGVWPRIARKHEVFYVHTPLEHLLETIGERYGVRTTDGLARTWLEIEAKMGKPLVVLIDRLEQVYTQPNPGLLSSLRSLLDAFAEAFTPPATQPQGKLVLAFAKEWLAEVHRAMSDHHLAFNCCFLEPLSDAAILEVLEPTRLATQSQLLLDPALPAEVARSVTQDLGTPIAPTLQVLLCKMWNLVIPDAQGIRHFDQTLFQTVRQQGFLLSDFLNEQLQHLDASQRSEERRVGKEC